MADYNKLDQQLVRRMDKLDAKLAQESGREPLPETNKLFYKENIYFEDHTIIEGVVIKVFDRFTGYKDGVYLDQYGPWALFKIQDIIQGDEEAKLEIGALVLGKWNNKRKSYYPYLYKPEINELDKEILNLCDMLRLDFTDLLK